MNPGKLLLRAYVAADTQAAQAYAARRCQRLPACFCGYAAYLAFRHYLYRHPFTPTTMQPARPTPPADQAPALSPAVARLAGVLLAPMLGVVLYCCC